MNNETILHDQATGTHEAGHEIHEHHHHESFITKYVFSQDHKMIARQFLITGIIWAIIGGLFSVLFRLQLGYPETTFPWLEDILGHWAKGGKIHPEFYYALVTMHGTVLVFFVLTAGLSGTFANFLIPLQVGARDMASPMSRRGSRTRPRPRRRSRRSPRCSPRWRRSSSATAAG